MVALTMLPMFSSQLTAATPIANNPLRIVAASAQITSAAMSDQLFAAAPNASNPPQMATLDLLVANAMNASNPLQIATSPCQLITATPIVNDPLQIADASAQLPAVAMFDQFSSLAPSASYPLWIIAFPAQLAAATPSTSNFLWIIVLLSIMMVKISNCTIAPTVQLTTVANQLSAANPIMPNVFIPLEGRHYEDNLLAI
jgi:hypothetical protein